MTNIDITLNPNLLDGAVAAVSGGHDEYWSIPYRDALTRLRDAGGNLAFFGANGCYWRVRIPDSVPTQSRSSSLVTNRPHWTR